MGDYIVGVDEAGRGPLVGDMFVVGVICEKNKLKLLQSLGVRDSKMLSRSMREQLFHRILKVIDDYHVVRFSPRQIDSENINQLFQKAIQEILDDFLEKYHVVETYVDATGNANKIKGLIKRKLKFKGKLVVEYKADRNYVIVSTASIIAKVLRDRHISELSKIYGNIGSGYPSDAKTIAWIKRYYEKFGELPPIVRRKWKTLRKVLD